MGKLKRGSAYIMVVFVSFPIILAALTALAVSVNSRNITARHSDFFGMYELAVAANLNAMSIFEDAYFAKRITAHRNALYPIVAHETNDGKSITLPEDYVNRFRYYLLPLIKTHLEGRFNRSGNIFTQNFTIKLGTEHVFYGRIQIRFESNGIYFRSEVTKQSDNIVIMRERTRGIVWWSNPTQQTVYLCETNQIKKLDFFTPRVVELMKYERNF